METKDLVLEGVGTAVMPTKDTDESVYRILFPHQIDEQVVFEHAVKFLPHGEEIRILFAMNATWKNCKQRHGYFFDICTAIDHDAVQIAFKEAFKAYGTEGEFYVSPADFSVTNDIVQERCLPELFYDEETGIPYGISLQLQTAPTEGKEIDPKDVELSKFHYGWWEVASATEEEGIPMNDEAHTIFGKVHPDFKTEKVNA